MLSGGFSFDIVLPKKEICNLQKEAKEITALACQGRRAVIYGRRNTGKTSLIQSVVIPNLVHQSKLDQKQAPVIISADLIGVNSVKEIAHRLKVGLEHGLSKAFPAQSTLRSIGSVLKSVRPSIKSDPLSGELSISLAIDENEKNHAASLSTVFEEIRHISRKRLTVVVLDEFQDIAAVEQAQGLLRAEFQNLPKNFPVLVLGSKRHLLAKIFGSPGAPLSGWGVDVEIPTVESESYLKAYHRYVQDRLGSYKLSVSREVFEHWVELVQAIPEAINILGDKLIRDHVSSFRSTDILRTHIDQAFAGIIKERRGRFEERVSLYSSNERAILTALAKNEPVLHPKGKAFLRLLSSLSPTSVFNIFRRLEDNADIYRTERGYVVGDPLLAGFLRVFR